MILIGCPPTPPPQLPNGAAYTISGLHRQTLPLPVMASLYLCVSVSLYVGVCTCDFPASIKSLVPDHGLTPPSTPPFASSFLHTYFLLNTCSSYLPSQKSLQISSICPPCYVSCLHEIGFCFLFFLVCFLRFCLFSPSVILAVVEILIAGNYFIHFKCLCLFFVFNIQLRYLYFCNIKCVVFFLSLLRCQWITNAGIFMSIMSKKNTITV